MKEEIHQWACKIHFQKKELLQIWQECLHFFVIWWLFGRHIIHTISY